MYRILSALALVLVSAAGVTAQTGTINGRVLDGGTEQPLVAVQVYLQGLNVGTLTQANGSYVLRNVRPGTHQIRFQRIGYGLHSQSVTVPANGEVTVNATLREAALALDEIVVTGTAGGTQRRAIGNVVASVDASKVIASSPARSVEQLIGGRTPGLISLPAAGQVGTGAPIRIRGISSMSLTNEPIVFIDGVRMDADPRQGPGGQRGGNRITRLGDLNPEDIQSVEIIKGPSAATLYGTEASNGVIQIITKRGATGKPQFDVSVRSGTNWMMNPEGRAGLLYMPDPATGLPVGINLYEYEAQNRGGPIFTNGGLMGFAGNLRGGTEAVRYFASASYDDDSGIVDFNWDKRFSGRLNLDLILTEKLSARMGSAYIKRNTSLMQTGFNQDPFSNLVWGNPRTLNLPLQGWFQAPPSEWSKIEALANNDRVTTNLELRYNLFKWLTQRLAAGIDVNQGENSTLYPRQPEGAAHFWTQLALGSKSSTRVRRSVLSLDYSGSGTYRLSPDIGFTTSLGFQYYGRERSEITATGTIFPASPITTVSGGSQKAAEEEFEENATVGVFLQQQADWKNRLFITAAIRGDDNSAFGSEYDAAIYPKLSASWVVTEEPFWSFDFVDQLKLRAAWGAAGQQPGTFDAPRLYDPEVGYGDSPALLPSAYGNPQLKPERSEELEFGVDLSFLSGRADISLTRYQRRVTDAIVRRPVPPSSGFGSIGGITGSGSQIVNLGEIKGWGNELGFSARLIQRARFGWEAGLQVATNGNEIIDLGGLPLILAGGRQEHRSGFPIGAIFVKDVLSARINETTGAVLEALCDGGTGTAGLERGGAPVPCANAPRIYWGASVPTWQLGINTAVTLLRNLRLEARVEGNGGHSTINTETRATHNLGLSKTILLHNDPLVQATRMFENDKMGLYDGSFAKLRELSATLTIPGSFAQRFRATSGSLTFAARNLMMIWTGAHGFSTYRDGRVEIPLGGLWTWDPEIRSTGQIQSDFQTVLPPLSSVLVTLRFSF
jgi:TonB-dependent SusC/RagA subfamily outer membrane receptor